MKTAKRLLMVICVCALVTFAWTNTINIRVSAQYSVTIEAYCNVEAAAVNVAITMDGSPTGFNTPHTFSGLTGEHNFTLAGVDASGHQFREWSGGTIVGTTLIVISAGSYTGYYGSITTIHAYSYSEQAPATVAITMDGSPTGFNTPHTFAGLSGTHDFTVPSVDDNGHPFREWSTGETSTTLTVTLGLKQSYTAFYGSRVTIFAYCKIEKTGVSVAITMDGSPTGYNTPHTFVDLTGVHDFTVPSADANGHPFYEWSTGEASTTLHVTLGFEDLYTAFYYLPPNIYVNPSSVIERVEIPPGASEIHYCASNYATNGSVTNPANAIDMDDATYASFDITATTYPNADWFEVTTFNATGAPTSASFFINVSYIFTFTPSPFGSVEYRTLVCVGSKNTTLQDWYYILTTSPTLKTFAYVQEPNDDVWNRTDVANMRIRVEVRKRSETGAGEFRFYESRGSMLANSRVVAICIEDALDLYSWQFFLNWTGPVLNVTGVVEGPFLQAGGSTSFVRKLFNDYNYTYVTCTLTGVVPGVNGNGTLAYVEFLMESYGETSLHLYNTVVKDSISPEPLDHTTTDGFFVNTFLSDIRGPESPPGSGLYPSDGVVDGWDYGFIGLAFGKNSGDPDWDDFKIADIRGPGAP